MEINGKTRVCGLIGNPVEHSISPLIHNTLSARTNTDMAYVTFKVEETLVSDAVKGAYALNVLGMNVTVPHKQNVIPYLVDIDDTAKAIGAVNTLVRVDGGYKGYNTDIIGLNRSLIEEGVKIEGEEVILLGAGGAARAIAFMLASNGAKKVYILNRSIDKAKNIADNVNSTYNKDVVTVLPLSDYKQIKDGKYLCIQTTSVGLFPNVNDVVIEDEDFYKLIHTGVDIIYNPSKTRFMKEVENCGGKAINGLGMLLYQAISAYELWNDIKVSKEDISAIYDIIKK